jgi:hypothetical protein
MGWPYVLFNLLLNTAACLTWQAVIARVLAAKDSRVQRLLDTYKTDNARVVDELFLSTLSRPASSGEKQVAVTAIDKNRVEGAQNLQWALINQVEFFFNH